MRDRDLQDLLRRASEPRPLPDDLRDRLSRAVSGSDDELTLPFGLDAPRAVPAELRARLLVAVGAAATTRPLPGRPVRPRDLPPTWLVRTVAVAAAVLLLAGTTALATQGRGQPPAPAAVSTTTTTSMPLPVVPETTPTTPAPAVQLAAPPAKGVLVAYDSCAALISDIKSAAMKRVTSGGLPGRFGTTAGVTAAAAGSPNGSDDAPASSDAAAAPSFSTTNIQEAGVDEADVVKTDGRRVFHLARNPSGGRMLRRLDVGAGGAEVTAALPLDWEAQELFLVGNRVVLLGNRYSEKSYAAVTWVLDAAGPKLRVLWTQETEGSYRAARLVGDEVRMVVISEETPEWVQPADGSPEAFAAAKAANRRLIQRSKLEDWVPRSRAVDYRGRTPRATETSACSCEETRRANGEFTGFGQVTVHSFKVADPQLGEAAGVRGAADTVYASTGNLYVATQEFVSEQPTTVEPPTRIHQFELPAGAAARYAATGTVRGSAYGQFALSEHEGHLRIATTESRWDRPTDQGVETESFVTVLRRSGDVLAEVGRLGGLGKAGERIFSTRFLGNRGYVVTFRRTDPLYVLDLSDPARPRKVGELEIPGFSDYLHPLEGNRLVGIGIGPGANGEAGLQVSIFDVSDPARPTRTASKTLPGLRAAGDHRAFLYWKPTGSIILPAAGYEPVEGSPERRPFWGAISFSERDGLNEQWRVTHADRPSARAGYALIERLVVVGDRIFSFSDAGVLTSQLSDGVDVAWRAY